MLQGTLLPQGIVGPIFAFNLIKWWSNVPYAIGDEKGSIAAPFLSVYRIQTAAIMAATQILPGHLPQSGTFLSKITIRKEPFVQASYVEVGLLAR